MKNIAVWLCAMCLSITVVSAQCIRGNCQDGVGAARLRNGDTYSGQWKRGQMHGQGVYVYKSGARYEGSFFEGSMHGQGMMRYPDGAYYTGAWVKNRKEGEGKLVTPSGKTTQGLWEAGQYVGMGNSRPNAVAVESTRLQSAARLRDCNSEYCEDGRGRYRYRDGAIYEGDFEDGQPSGNGIVRYGNGDVYQGQWFGSAPDGVGVYTFANGRSIEGRWDEGKFVERISSGTSSSLASQNSSSPPRRPSSSNSPVLTPAQQAALRRPANGKSEMYAVVVGVGAYSAMQTLNYTDDDAYQMYAFLKSPEGGALSDDQVVILVDELATKGNIERALQDKLSRADADDIVIFYFSGHGVGGSFVPVDFDGQRNLLSHARVEELFNSSAARHKLVVADACHSGGLLAARSAERSSTRLYEAFAKSSGGTALLLSSKHEEVSLEASGLRSGVFSHFLLRGMKGEADRDQDKIVTVEELYQYLYGRVRDYTGKRQTPVLSGDFDRKMPVAALR